MQLLVPNTALIFDWEGARVITQVGKWPVVREGHPILKGREGSFSPIVVDYETKGGAAQVAAEATRPARAPRARKGTDK